MKRAIETVVVVGRGIAGLATAYELLRGGRAVIVVAPESDEGMGTRAAAGLSSIKGAITASKPLFALKKQGYEGLRNWLADVEKDAGVRIPQLWMGSTEVFFDLTEYEGIRHRVFHRKFTGAYRAQCLGREELYRRMGGLGVSCGEAAGGFHFAADGWFDPRQGLVVLEQAVRKLGGVIIDAIVERIVDGADRGLAVHTTKGVVTGSDVIVAAGQASNTILGNSVQYDVATALKQDPYAGETYLGPAPSSVPNHLVQYRKTTLAVVDGEVTYGSSCYAWHDLGEKNTSRDAVRTLAVKALQDKLFRLGWQKSILTRSIWGVRGRPSDRAPLFGPLFLPSRNRRIWLVSGLYKNGLQLSHLFAREMRRIFCELPAGPTLIDPLSSSFEPFRPTRLTAPAP